MSLCICVSARKCQKRSNARVTGSSELSNMGARKKKKLELMEEQPIQRLIFNQIAKTCECHETLYFILLLSVRTNVIKSSN